MCAQGGLGKSSSFIASQSCGFVVEGNITAFISKVLFIFLFLHFHATTFFFHQLKEELEASNPSAPAEW